MSESGKIGQIEALSLSQEQGWKDRIAPAVEQVGPGTWAIPVPIPNNPLVYTYCYALAEDKGVSLIDPGWNGAPQLKRLEEGLAGIGYALTDINGIAVTHYHQDHIGLVPALLKRNPDAWVAMQHHDLEAVAGFAKLRAQGRDGKAALPDVVKLYGVPEERRSEIDWAERDDEARKKAGKPPVGQAEGSAENAAGTAECTAVGSAADPAAASPANGTAPNGAAGAAHEPDHFADRPQASFRMPRNVVVLQHDDVLPLAGRTVRGVWTPGHTFGHTAFVDHELGGFFSGDHLLPKITPNIGLDATSLTHSLGDYLNSLERMRALDDSLQVLPAHGFRFAGLQTRARQIEEHHADRLAEVGARMEATDDHSVYSIAQGLHWSRGFEALHDFNLYAALSETAAHMYYLGVPVGE